MRRLFILIAALLVAATAATFAQSKDFSGRWVIDKEKTAQGQPVFVIEMTKAEMIINAEGTGAPELRFSLEGKETTFGGLTATAAWKGNALATTIVSPNGTMTIVWSREGDWLVQEGPIGRGGAEGKAFYKKAAK